MLRLLFVCLGNICRSPAAEGVMQHLIDREGLSGHVQVDSAGTIDYHAGKLADSRMIKAAKARGIELTHRSRPITADDLADHDLILVMDQMNLTDISLLDPSGEFQKKIKLLCEFCIEHSDSEVPDPYLGTADDFEYVLNLCEDACNGLLRHIKNESLLA